MDNNKILKPEDYIEPQCPFCTEQHRNEPPVRSIPSDRVIQKLDEYLSKNNYDAAEKHLLYWLEEAVSGRDSRGMLLLRNELMGLYRKLGKKESATDNAEKALALISEMNIPNEIAAATTYINTATVYKAFGMPQKSLPLFEKACEIYESNLKSNDERLGGLYNNMALTLVDLKRFSEANILYHRALTIMQRVKNGEPEQAVTHLNMANAAEAELGIERAESLINKHIHEAMILLDNENTPRNGNYAFVCEKCAGTFGYYGYFFYEKELKERARRIYEGN